MDLLPLEIWSLILEYLPVPDLLSITRTCQDGARLLAWSRVLRPGEGKALRVEALSLFRQIRVEGPLICTMDDPESTGITEYSQGLRRVMLRISEQVQGGFDLRLGNSIRQIGSPSLRADLLNLVSLLRISLQILQERAQRYPESRVQIVLARHSYLEWNRGAFNVQVPITINHQEISQEVFEFFREFIIKIPVTHLTIHPTSINNYTEEECGHEADSFIDFLLHPEECPLTSIGIPLSDWGRDFITQITHLKFPLLQRVEFYLDPRFYKMGWWNSYSIVRRLVYLPGLIAVEGDLYFPCTNEYHLQEILEETKNFSSSIQWKILLRNCLSSSLPVKRADLETLPTKLDVTSLAVSRMKELDSNRFSFWHQES